MTAIIGRDPDAVERWLTASLDGAQTLLAMVCDLPGLELQEKVAARPELQSVGMLSRFLELGQEVLERTPRRVLELTAVVIEYAPRLVVPPGAEAIPPRLEGCAWRDRAEALRRVGRPARARDAIAAARAIFERTPPRDWYVATADMVEAPLLDDLGERLAALELVRRARETFERFHDFERHVQAVMMETSILWRAGKREAVTRLWDDRAEAARQRQDLRLGGTLEARIGRFELEHGDPAHAEELLTAALALLEQAGLAREAARTRWWIGETAAAQGRLHDAVSQLYLVQAELLRLGAIRDAALVSTRILELLLLAGRDSATAAATAAFVRTLGEARMPPRCLAAVEWLQRRAAGPGLTLEDVRDVGRYFEEAPDHLERHPDPWTRLAIVR